MSEYIYDGYTVYQGMTDKAKARTSTDNVSDVLDSLHRLTKAARQQAVPSGFVNVPAACTSEMEDAYDRACLRDGLSAVYLHLPAYEAMLAAAPQAEHMLSAAPAPAERVEACEVSAETYSSDGTSDIITCNLPIGTKLYTAPQPSPAPAAPDVAGLVAAGSALSNIVYNLAQRPGVTLDRIVCDSIDSARKSWDATLAAFQQEG